MTLDGRSLLLLFVLFINDFLLVFCSSNIVCVFGMSCYKNLLSVNFLFISSL